MTDTAATEVAEPAPPAPEAAAAPAPEAEPDDTRSARERVIDHLTDSEGPQSVEQILAGTGLNRNACEQAIFRAKKAEQIIWVAPGVYALAPPKPLPSSRNGHSNEEWVARIEAWQVNPASWNIEEDGPPPNDPNHRIPLDVVGRFNDRRARGAKEREKRDAAAAKQEAADAALRDQLIAATGGNFTPGPGIQDISPIKVALELVPLNYILSAIRHKTDRKCYPKNEPATSWREVRLLKAIAEDYCQHLIVPSLVDAWGKAAAKAPEKPVQRAEASPGIQPAPAPENEPEASPQQPAAPSNGNAGIDPTTADAAPTRESVLAAFARNRVPPHPAPQPVPQPPPPERQAEPEPISEEGWEELIAGFMAGMVNWNRRRLGPEPGQPGCRAPRHILRSFRL